VGRDPPQLLGLGASALVLTLKLGTDVDDEVKRVARSQWFTDAGMLLRDVVFAFAHATVHPDVAAQCPVFAVLPAVQ
jgi:hypothetical protein